MSIFNTVPIPTGNETGTSVPTGHYFEVTEKTLKNDPMKYFDKIRTMIR